MQNNIFSGLFVGQNLVRLKEVDSTNTYLKYLLSNSKPLPEGTVIMAESQYAGRGQQHNKWHSDAGKNLTFSILLKPSFVPLSNQFDINRAVSLGTAEALRSVLGDGLKVKWPNDIYYQDKKLGGILIENIIAGNAIRHTIVGIGLNVNQDSFPETLTHATSVKQILQRDYDLDALLSQICSHIEAWYLKLKAGKTDELRIQYLQQLYWLNEQRRFKADDMAFTGIIRGVKPEGLLEVECGGVIQDYNLKQIEFLNKR